MARASGIRRAAAAVLITAASVAGGSAATGLPAGAQSGADAVAACEPATAVPEVGPRACKSVEAGLWLGAQTCRRVPGAEEQLCPAIDGRRVSEAAMVEYEAGWLARALDLQRDLDHHVALVQSLLPHTHNSANSAAYAPSISTLDANQVVSLRDQLRLGIRAVEIDVHWTPNPSGDPSQGFAEAVQCHGEPVATPAGVVHAGCSVDRTLEENLGELRAWLDDNPDEFVLLYLENALDDDPDAHARAAEVIDAQLGQLVFRPAADGGCEDLPVRTESKSSILATGARVLVTGNCGPAGSAWNDRVFQRGDAWDESGSTTNYECGADRARLASPPDPEPYEDTLVRRYEDSTWLSKMAGGGSYIAPDVYADMVRCGVNLPGLDQVHAGDDRLPGLVWSWRQDEPATTSTGACAAQGADARFFAADCAAAKPVACRTSDGGWAISPDAVGWASAQQACTAAGHVGVGVPFNGWDNGLLRTAAADRGDVWLAYSQGPDGGWVTGAPPPPEPDPEPPADDRPGRGHGGKPSEPGPPAGAKPATRGERGIDAIPASSDGPGDITGVALLLLGIGAAGAAQVRRRRR